MADNGVVGRKKIILEDETIYSIMKFFPRWIQNKKIHRDENLKDEGIYLSLILMKAADEKKGVAMKEEVREYRV